MSRRFTAVCTGALACALSLLSAVAAEGGRAELVGDLGQERACEAAARKILEERRLAIEAIAKTLHEFEAGKVSRPVAANAIRLAGKLRAAELADLLARHVDFAVLPGEKSMGGIEQLLAEAYPTPAALINIGRPAIAPIVDVLREAKPESFRSQLARNVLVSVAGNSPIRRVEEAIKEETDGEAVKRLKGQLKLLRDDVFRHERRKEAMEAMRKRPKPRLMPHYDDGSKVIVREAPGDEGGNGGEAAARRQEQ